MTYEPIPLADQLMTKVCEAYGIDVSRVGRIIIDAKPMEPLKVYVELYGNQQMLQLDWGPALQEAKVSWGDKPSEGGK